MTGLIGMPLKVGFTLGFVFHTFEIPVRITSEGISTLDMMGSICVFGLITTTAFSLIMVTIMY